MTGLLRIASLGALAATGWLAGWCPAAHGQDAHVGWIEKVGDKCEGKWRANDGAEMKKLDVAKDHYRFLYPGESVRCDGGGLMTLQILDNRAKEIAKRDGWCTIHNEGAVCEKEKTGGTKREDSAALKRIVDERALRAFGRPAGRQRGFSSAIFSPAAESAVRAATIVLRWNEIAGAARITLRLRDKYHSVLWEQADVEAGRRQLVSSGARAALSEYRDKGGAGPFSLTIAIDGAEQPAVQFSILNADEEAALDKDLADCEKKSGLLRPVCRTYAFSRREMWNDAAEEHEAALKLAPESTDLILATLAAEKSIGNARRAGELRAALPAGTAIAE